MKYKKETITYAEALMFDGENQVEVVKLIEDMEKTVNVVYATLKGNLRGEELTVLIITYDIEGKNSYNKKKTEIGKGKVLVVTGQNIKVMDREKFEKQYENC